MFSLVSGVYDSYFAPTQLNLLIVGASGSGKTAFLERLKVTEFTKKPKQQQQQSECCEVPESFLPVALRVPKTQQQSLPHKKKDKKKKKQQPAAGAGKGKRRSFLACPAPSKYNKAKEESSSSEEEEEGEENDDDVNAKGTVPDKPAQNGLGRNSSMDMSLQDVPIGGDSETSVVVANGKDTPQDDNDDDDDEDEEDQEHDLKPKSVMLPLHKIRPTIGQNLAKVEMCGAQCRVWDLGGKMHDLWSRYYQDADAVVFVWKIVDDANPIQHLENGDNDDSDDDDDEDWPPVTAAQQLGLLQSLRDSIADDVPFLIWGHWFPPSSASSVVRKPKDYQYDEPYSTAALLPHYHNPLMNVYFGSAKTGAGVRTAMEWLIPTATRQKKFRDKSPTDDDLQKA